MLKVEIDTTDAHAALDALQARMTTGAYGVDHATLEDLVDRKLSELLEQLTSVARGG